MNSMAAMASMLNSLGGGPLMFPPPPPGGAAPPPPQNPGFSAAQFLQQSKSTGTQQKKIQSWMLFTSLSLLHILFFHRMFLITVIITILYYILF